MSAVIIPVFFRFVLMCCQFNFVRPPRALSGNHDSAFTTHTGTAVGHISIPSQSGQHALSAFPLALPCVFQTYSDQCS